MPLFPVRRRTPAAAAATATAGAGLAAAAGAPLLQPQPDHHEARARERHQRRLPCGWHNGWSRHPCNPCSHTRSWVLGLGSHMHPLLVIHGNRMSLTG
uniref:Uncharacterized protein n=1 Tax=Zea mays TaxID=4577 RepID=A0A804QH18_MAIZE